MEWCAPLYLFFNDFDTAFDTLKHDAIWQAVACKGEPVKKMSFIKELYSDAACRVKHENSLSNSVEVQASVREGCVL